MSLKKVFTVLTTVVMTVAMSVNAFAASTAELKKALMNSSAAEALNINMKDFAAQIDNYLSSVKYSSSDINEIISRIDELDEIVAESGINSIEELKASEDLETIMAAVNGIADAAGVEVVLAGDGVINIVDSDGTMIAEATVSNKGVVNVTDEGDKKKPSSNSKKDKEKNESTIRPSKAINQTGFGLETTAAVVALMTVTLTACTVYAKRRAIVEV